MEKTIRIDGKDIVFKITGSLPLRYKTQFRSDFFGDIVKLENMVDKKSNKLNFDAFDLEIFYNISWCMAKAANPELPPPLEWLDTFDTFPILEILPELQELLVTAISSSKPKN